jgi:hypothetical protein
MRKDSSQKDLRLPRGSLATVLSSRESCLRLSWWKTMVKDGNRLDRPK